MTQAVLESQGTSQTGTAAPRAPGAVARLDYYLPSQTGKLILSILTLFPFFFCANQSRSEEKLLAILGVGSIFPHPLAGDFPTGLHVWDRPRGLRQGHWLAVHMGSALPASSNATWVSQAPCHTYVAVTSSKLLKTSNK